MNAEDVRLMAQPAMKVILEHELTDLHDKLMEALNAKLEAKEITPYDREQILRLNQLGSAYLQEQVSQLIVPKETVVDEIKRYRSEYAEQGNEDVEEAKP